MSTKTTLSTADALFIGRGYDPRTADFWDRKGVALNIASTFSLGVPELGDADFLIKAATGTEVPDEAETVTYLASDTNASPHDAAATTTTINGVTVWDVRDGATYGRNLVSVATHDSAIVAMTVLISGYDYTGQAMSESHPITAGGTTKTRTGDKAFAYVKSIAITAAADASANTLNIGTGEMLGLPFAMEKKGHMTAATLGGAQELINVASNAVVYEATGGTATTTTGDVRGRITFNAALDGSKEAIVTYYVADWNTQEGVAGVVQA